MRRHPALPAAGAGPDRRGPRQPHAVPVQPRGRRRRRAARAGRRSWSTALRARPELRDVEQRPAGRGPAGVARRSTATTASRLGITPQLIDDTLYDAFGQRQISTIFTQLNQYRVVLEVAPAFQQAPDGARRPLRRRRRPAARCRSRTVTRVDARRRRRSSISHQGQFPAVTLSFNLAPGVVARRGGRGGRTRRPRELGLPPQHPRQLPGHRAGLPGRRSPTSRCSSSPRWSPSTSCSACSTRATSTRSRSSRRCPRPASARILALLLCRHRPQRHRADRHHPADRHREEERHHDDRLRARGRARRRASRRDEAIYEACLLRFRPIMMTTMAALLGALPLALGTRRRRRAAPPARHRDRRRPDREPGAHALHDAGHLPRVRPAGAARARRVAQPPVAPEPRAAPP